MESDKGPVATEAPPFSPPASLRAAPLAPTSVESLAVEAAARATQSLKRQREATPTSPEFDLNTRLDPALSPTKSARLLNVSVRHSPALLTGAAAAEDEKRRQEEQFRLQVAGASDNPAYRAQAALMSVESLAMSRPQDAPATEEHRVENHHAEPHQEMEVEPPTAHQLEQHTEHHVEQPVETHGEHHIAPPAEQHVDPQLVPLPEQHIQNDAEARRQSVSPEHHVPIEASTTAPTTAVESELAAKRDPVADGPADRPIPAEPTVPITESPAPMDVDGRNDRQSSTTQPLATTVEAKGGLSMSYPGSLQATESMSAPTVRGMTLPITPSHAATPRSPNSKKHRCPYCETEFTRHHNLKSHLLTHSQEKPYVCHTCQMRFRRLHDLKRHSKLHTGEKPHICPKCDRKFARGDALARHSKGPGGCVGRRSSMGGSFLDDDMEGHSQLEGDSVMTDVVYDGANDESLTDEDRQRLGMQARNSSHTQGSDKNAETHHAYSSSGPSDSVLEALKSSISNLAANATAESHNETTESEDIHPGKPSALPVIAPWRRIKLTHSHRLFSAAVLRTRLIRATFFTRYALTVFAIAPVRRQKAD